jgi:hypothetical protein
VIETAASQRQNRWHKPDRHENLAVTVTITPRMPVATARVYTLPTVREIPPVPRPGTFDSTW